MAIKIPSTAEILAEILQEIKIDASDGVAVYEHSSVYDYVIAPLLDQVKDTRILADFISRSRSILELEEVVKDKAYQDALRYALNLTFPEVEELISLTIDRWAGCFNEFRKTSKKARGYVKLYFTTGDNVTLAAGLEIGTLKGIKFVTINSFNSFTPLLDNAEGLYFIESAVEAEIAGIKGNIEAGNAIVLFGNAANLVRVHNPNRFKFGSDVENDLQFIERLKNIFQSKRTNVIGGFINSMINYPGVQDVSVVMPEDPLQVRNVKNAVDVYLIGEEKLQSQEDIFNSVEARYAWERLDDELSFQIYPTPYESINQVAFKLSQPPLMEVSSVGYTSILGGSFTNVSNYNVSQDSTSVFANSIKAHDHIIIEGGEIPNNCWVKINYSYDRLYRDLQTLWKKYETRLIGADLLIKKATKKTVDISVEAYLTQEGEPFRDIIEDTIVSDCNIFFEGGVDSNNITRNMNRLGEKFDKSDILNVMLDVSRVDRINLNTLSIKIDGVEMDQVYEPNITQYLRLGTVTFLAVTSPNEINPITKKSFNDLTN